VALSQELRLWQAFEYALPLMDKKLTDLLQVARS